MNRSRYGERPGLAERAYLEAEAARGKAEKGRKPRKPRRGRNGC